MRLLYIFLYTELYCISMFFSGEHRLDIILAIFLGYCQSINRSILFSDFGLIISIPTCGFVVVYWYFSHAL